MKILIISALMSFLITGSGELSFDFGEGKAGKDWRIVNDGVMGGLSNSAAGMTENSVRFKGHVSLDNNGGFAAFRGPYGQVEMEGMSTMEIRYRSTGQGTSLQLSIAQQYWIPNFKYFLETTDNEWKTVKVDLTEFKQYQMGRLTGKSLGPEDLSEIKRVGFITANKKEGDFEIEIDYLRFR